MTLTPEQRTKLPKWAREELTDLEREVRRLNARIEEGHTLTRPAADDSAARYFGNDGKWYELPSTTLRLKDRDGWIEVQPEQGGMGIQVRASYALQLDMRVGNTVCVRDLHSYEAPK